MKVECKSTYKSNETTELVKEFIKDYTRKWSPKHLLENFSIGDTELILEALLEKHHYYNPIYDLRTSCFDGYTGTGSQLIIRLKIEDYSKYPRYQNKYYERFPMHIIRDGLQFDLGFQEIYDLIGSPTGVILDEEGNLWIEWFITKYIYG